MPPLYFQSYGRQVVAKIVNQPVLPEDTKLYPQDKLQRP